MIKKIVKFYGTETDDCGMPTPYYSYLIISSSQKNMTNTAVATAMSISQNSPQPNPPHCAYTPTMSGVDSANGAFCELINRLSEMTHIKDKNLIREDVEFNE
ncbi:hypothetical protein AB4181_19075 [Vibrio lentus]